MVPHISAIAMNIPEVRPATPPLEAAGAVANSFVSSFVEPPRASFESRQAASADDMSSRVADLIAQGEERSRESQEGLDKECERLLGSGGALRPADMFRLRQHANMNSEMLQFYKKVADQFTNGVQTLARGN
ncbi:hypothetical protein LMG29542_05718 [Paraburkholderia humisilvae]|uniref:Uncharacterized protein n=2 Tax=Paraburkholderia humisilvae TaxID=627669 RepID=A0A6J5EMT7_9BURK|nr:hypothetical protein LMG29542_05718 [Paraburkholderia humisilvae]